MTKSSTETTYNVHISRNFIYEEIIPTVQKTSRVKLQTYSTPRQRVAGVGTSSGRLNYSTPVVNILSTTITSYYKLFVFPKKWKCIRWARASTSSKNPNNPSTSAVYRAGRLPPYPPSPRGRSRRTTVHRPRPSSPTVQLKFTARPILLFSG